MLQRKKDGLRRYTFAVYIPARYEVRHSRAERVVWILLSPLAVLLAGYCLIAVLGAAAAVGLWHVLFLFDGWKGVVFLLGLLAAALTAVLLLAGLALLCPLLAVKRRRDSLTVDGETLTLRRWRQRDKTFTFSDIGAVQARQGRQTLVLRDRGGRELCRLYVTMEGLDVLLADLRSRRALFVERAGRMPEVPPPLLSPGPRREEQALELPAAAPGWYRLAYAGAFAVIFAALLVFVLAVAVLAFSDGARLEALCLAPFALLAVLGMVWVRREQVEIAGDRIRRRDGRGRVTDCSFDDVAAVRIRTTVTGIGPISGCRLLDRKGETLLAPGAGMTGTGQLLADLIRRGVPFTY